MTSNSLSNAAATSTTPLNVLTSTPSSADTLSYADIQSIVANDFEIMDKQVFGSLNSKVQLVMSVSQHVINAGGKRMRPLITLCCAPACLSDEPSAASHASGGNY
jgi:octaprenyl-diphosphate synthase